MWERTDHLVGSRVGWHGGMAAQHGIAKGGCVDPAGLTWSDLGCVDPAGLTWSDLGCVDPAGLTWSDLGCVDPAGLTWWDPSLPSRATNDFCIWLGA
jgi:hypothetical protein